MDAPDAADHVRFGKNLVIALALFGLTSAAILTWQIQSPIFHTILDTSVFLTAALIALLLWDGSVRTGRPLALFLAIAFAVVAAGELVHTLIALERLSGESAAAAEVRWRAGTWGPTAYILPIGVGMALFLRDAPRRRGRLFALALIGLYAALLVIFQLLPRYSMPALFGISRPTLLGVPLLWAAVAFGYWRQRKTSQVASAVAAGALVMVLAHSFMLFSQPADNPGAIVGTGMVAHFGKIAAEILLLLNLIQIGAADTVRRLQAEAELTHVNLNLEQHIRQRTAALQATNINLQEQIALREEADHRLRQSQANVVQQERLRVLGQMASGIAHDINNAVSPLALHTASLKENETGLSSRMQAYLATVERVTNDVAATMARLREFYREREPLTAMRPFNLNAVVRQTVDLTRARWANMAQQRGATISVRQQLDPQLAPLLGHDNELREMLTNLIFNAVDALPQGGEILLSTSNVAATPPAEPRIRLEVTDNGAGMDEQTVQRCMEPFFTTKGERGTGLGLAMVFGTAKRHGAEIAIESAPGKGTTMRLEFPQAALQEVPAPAPRARLAPEPMRLLIIDDDPFVLDSMKVVLELDEHTVTQVDSGHKGVEIFRAARDRGEMFSAVITDLGMPHMNDTQVARAIKAISPSTPVILLTGWGQRLRMDDDATSDLDAYVDVVLSKPPQLDELREALARLA